MRRAVALQERGVRFQCFGDQQAQVPHGPRSPQRGQGSSRRRGGKGKPLLATVYLIPHSGCHGGRALSVTEGRYALWADTSPQGEVGPVQKMDPGAKVAILDVVEVCATHEAGMEAAGISFAQIAAAGAPAQEYPCAAAERAAARGAMWGCACAPL